MKTVCVLDQCSGCGACRNICPQNAITIEDSIQAYNAIIDEKSCVGCNLCYQTCPNVNPVIQKPPDDCRQGWADSETRSSAASGGLASAIMKSFIDHYGYVCSCLFENGEFVFCLTNDKERIKEFAGSKYVKSNPGTVYLDIKKLLSQGKRVLFVGLPCQVAALKNICCDSTGLYTIDLICHGTPSPKLLKKYVSEAGVLWENLQRVQFRRKNTYGLILNEIPVAPRRVVDNYLLMFLKGVSYTENCYSCKYASTNRISDITLGDAWGGMADHEPKGVSLVLCQTTKGEELLNRTDIHLEPMDLNVAISSNRQLYAPALRHQGRNRFVSAVEKGYKFRFAAFLAMPGLVMKQSIKYCLIKMRLLKDFTDE